ncbi:MAG: DUF262 domain-containing protein [Synechococcus sp. SB0670_bin_20]|nr:DUF262 domain-containing protein [Synechococcus sp. SB0670_bin_20]
MVGHRGGDLRHQERCFSRVLHWIPSSFKFSQLGLASILKQSRLIVPPNQRNYSWTKEEVTTLLQDFARSIGSEDTPYFVGTIVTIRKGNDVLEVVDGQQRLATTAIRSFHT